MPYVIKVALPDFDVKTATPEQCAIHSAYNCPKVDATKDHFLTIPVTFLSEPPQDLTAGVTTTTILHSFPHEYNYQPQLWLHADYTSNHNGTLRAEFGPGEAWLATPSVGNDAYVGVKADRTNVYVYIRKVSSLLVPAAVNVLSKSLTLRLYILADTAFE
jgi:hypothetical protein